MIRTFDACVSKCTSMSQTCRSFGYIEEAKLCQIKKDEFENDMAYLGLPGSGILIGSQTKLTLSS